MHALSTGAEPSAGPPPFSPRDTPHNSVAYSTAGVIFIYPCGRAQSSFCPKIAMFELCPGATFFSGYIQCTA